MFESWYGIVIITLFCILLNMPFGWWRSGLPKRSPLWFVAIHAPVPLVIIVRLTLGVSSLFIPLFIVASIFGQYLGGKIRAKTKKDNGNLG